jgi:catechol-2,3-dioxygenase
MPHLEHGDKYDHRPEKVISPSKLAHVVIRTSPDHFKPMVEFYKTFLGAQASYENEYISFMTYDDEHHRIAVVAIPETAGKDPKAAGLLHVAFTFDSLDDLAIAYRQRKAKGILPVWSINHGITTSIYYADPDGNQLETQVDSFETSEEASAYMASKDYTENPIGVDFDPEDLIKRLRSGEDKVSILKRPNIGPRSLPVDI